MNQLFVLLLFESVSGGELILVLLAVFLLFGPNKIPEIARGLAKGISDIKKATSGIQDEVNKTITPIKNELMGTVDKLKDEKKIDIADNNKESAANSPNESKAKLSG